MARTPQDIFSDHLAAVAGGDPDRIVEDFSPDAVMLTPDGALHGHDAIREFFRVALGALPEPELSLDGTVFDGDALHVRWSARSPRGRIVDAVDTLVFADDRIRLQTSVFRLELDS